MTLRNPLPTPSRDLREVNHYLSPGADLALRDATGAELFEHRILLERWLNQVNTELHRRYPGFGTAGDDPAPRPISLTPAETQA